MQRSMSVRKRVLFLFIMVKFLGCENTKKLPNPRNPKKVYLCNRNYQTNLCNFILP